MPGPATVAAALPKTDPEALRNFGEGWARTVRITVAALKAHDTAGEDLRNENMAAATRELKHCQDGAGGIVSSSFNLRLDTTNGSDRQLLAAIQKIGNGLGRVCQSARSYLETKSAADFSDAEKHFDDVVAGIFQAQQLARLKYQSLGGDPDTLLNFKAALH